MSLILQKFYKTLLYKSLLVALMLLFSFSLSLNLPLLHLLQSYCHTVIPDTFWRMAHGSPFTQQRTCKMPRYLITFVICYQLFIDNSSKPIGAGYCTQRLRWKSKNQTLYPEDYNVLRLERNDPDKMWHVQLVAVSTSLGCSSCQKSSKLWREAVHQRNLCQ